MPKKEDANGLFSTNGVSKFIAGITVGVSAAVSAYQAHTSGQTTSTSAPSQVIPMSQNGAQNSQPKKQPPPQQQNQDETKAIVIASDFTATRDKPRVGGLLRLPKTKEVYFYSLEVGDWNNLAKLPDDGPDKKAMLSALLALEIFRSKVKSYRDLPKCSSVKLLCKGANSVFDNGDQYTKDGVCRKMYEDISALLQSAPFHGIWRKGSSHVDRDLNVANILSKREEAPLYPEYTLICVSPQAAKIMKSLAKHKAIPPEFQVSTGQVSAGSSKAKTNGLTNSTCSLPTSSTQQKIAPQRTTSLATNLEVAGQEPENCIITTVYANPGRAAGVLRFPKLNEIYYYSYDWTRELSENCFKHPDKYQIINALLALYVFEDKVTAFRQRKKCSSVNLYFKGDSTLSRSRDHYSISRECVKNVMCHETEAKLEGDPFRGKWTPPVNPVKLQDDDLRLVIELAKLESDAVVFKKETFGKFQDYTYEKLGAKAVRKQMIKVLSVVPGDLKFHSNSASSQSTSSQSSQSQSSQSDGKLGEYSWGQRYEVVVSADVDRSPSPCRSQPPTGTPESSNSGSTSRTSQSSSSTKSSPNSSIPTELSLIMAEDPDSPVVALHASKDRATGMLKLPKGPTIYFYSFKWATLFRLPTEKYKLHLINTLLALELFGMENRYPSLRKTYYDKSKKPVVVVFKSSQNEVWLEQNPFPISSTKSSETLQHWKTLMTNNMTKMLNEPFRGSVSMKPEPDRDRDVRFVEFLAKLGDSELRKADIVKAGYDEKMSVHNISSLDYAALHTLAVVLPPELRAQMCR